MFKKRKKINPSLAGLQLLTLYFLLLQSVYASCPNSCTCGRSGVQCISMDLKTVPDNMDDKITELDLSHNEISDTENLQDFADLEILNLSHNKIKKIEYDIFDDMDSLDELDLSHNEIHAVDDDTFEWNPLKLRSLRLHNNKLKFVEHYTFYDLEELEELYLQNNVIASIHSLAFSNMKRLKKLDVSGNHLITFSPEWIRDPIKMDPDVHLDFKNNLFECDCGMRDALDYFDSAEYMEHSRNTSPVHKQIVCTDTDNEGKQLIAFKTKKDDLPCVDPVIKQLSKTTSVQAGKNIKLQCIAEGKPKPIISWVAPNDDVYRLDSDGFEGIDVDETGSLIIENVNSKDQGKYICVATSAANSKQQQAHMTLTVTGDDPPEEDSDDEYFDDIDKDGPFDGIEIEHDSNFDLSDVDLGDYCPRKCDCSGEDIDCSYYSSRGNKIRDFPKLPKTSSNQKYMHLRLNMKFNELGKIPERLCDHIGVTKLEELDLEGNIINTIHPNAFAGCTQITRINLKRNELRSEELVAFRNMPRLSGLILDGNHIENIPAKTFTNNPKLNFVYIRNSKLMSIDANFIQGSPEFSTLNLADNALPDVHVQMVKNLIKMSGKAMVHYQENPIDCNSCNIKSLVGENKNMDGQGLDYSRITCGKPSQVRDMQLDEIQALLPKKCSDPSANMPFVGRSSWFIFLIKLSLLAGMIYGGYVIYKKWQLRRSIEPRFQGGFQGDMVPHYQPQNQYEYDTGSRTQLNVNSADQEVMM